MNRAVTALFNQADQARSAVRHLRELGFSEREIGLLVPDDGAQHSTGGAIEGNKSLEGSVTGGIVGGSLGAILVATGALVVPGIGPFISGGILASLVGGTAGWLVGGLTGLGISEEDARYYEEQVHRGRALVTVRAGAREVEAIAVLQEHGGDTRATAGSSAAPDNSAQQEWASQNRAQRSGQFDDMMRSTSDDGTIPPTAEREAVTTPMRETSASLRATPPVAGGRSAGRAVPSPSYDRTPEARVMSSAERAAVPTATNPVPSSQPTADRLSEANQVPYQDEANPYGRDLPNERDAPLGGAGVIPPQKDPAHRTPPEQPGQDAANPLPQALDPEPLREPDEQRQAPLD